MKPSVEFSSEDFNSSSNLQMVTAYHTEESTKIDFWLVDSKEFTNKHKRRKSVKFDDVVIPMISAEDLILTKLLWNKQIYSQRHERDCIGIWHVQKGKLDVKYLKQRAKELGITELLDKIKKSKPIDY